MDAGRAGRRNDLLYNVLYTGGWAFADLLNLVLLFPAALCLVLATRRVPPVIAGGLLLPLLIEYLRANLPGRSCTVADWIANAAGAAVGAAVGWIIHRRLSRRLRGDAARVQTDAGARTAPMARQPR